MKAGEDVICALAGLGVGVYPSPGMLSGCEKFLCQLFSSGFTSAKALRWHMFKQLKGNQGDNLPCTELCKCEGAENTCNYVAIDQNSSDDEENEDVDD